MTGTSLLPPSASPFERRLSGVLARVSDVPVPLDTLWDPQTCPIELLPWLAWTFSVDVWLSSWPEATKRAVVASSFQVHRHKGTPGAIVRALGALGLDHVTVEESRAYGGGPHRFRVEADVSGRGLTDAEMVAASATIAAAKNVRSKLDRLRVAIGIPSEGPRHGLATTMGEVVTIAPRTNTTLAAGDRADAFGAATYGVETITLFPREAA